MALECPSAAVRAEAKIKVCIFPVIDFEKVLGGDLHASLTQ
jgi:hypothetical protein